MKKLLRHYKDEYKVHFIDLLMFYCYYCFYVVVVVVVGVVVVTAAIIV